ncbi:MAG: hypothetical protein NTV30_01060, partial [Chloroflexi bacterium]|nr:hypothetical protein [Chloroflexota bacterium]
MERFEGALLSIPQSSRVVLSKLRSLDKKTGLCSNAEVSEILAWPRCSIANLFNSTVFSCYAGYIKPDREIYELTMKELGVSSE